METSRAPTTGAPAALVLLPDVSVDAAAWDDLEYALLGTEIDGAFEIGYQYTGEALPPADVVPGDLYEILTPDVEALVSLPTVRAETAPDHWPQIGRITFCADPDGTVAAMVHIADAFRESSAADGCGTNFVIHAETELNP